MVHVATTAGSLQAFFDADVVGEGAVKAVAVAPPAAYRVEILKVEPETEATTPSVILKAGTSIFVMETI